MDEQNSDLFVQMQITKAIKCMQHEGGVMPLVILSLISTLMIFSEQQYMNAECTTLVH